MASSRASRRARGFSQCCTYATASTPLLTAMASRVCARFRTSYLRLQSQSHKRLLSARLRATCCGQGCELLPGSQGVGPFVLAQAGCPRLSIVTVLVCSASRAYCTAKQSPSEQLKVDMTLASGDLTCYVISKIGLHANCCEMGPLLPSFVSVLWSVSRAVAVEIAFTAMPHSWYCRSKAT